MLRHPAFLDGATDTAFFDTHGLAGLAAPLADDATVRAVGGRGRLADAAHNRCAAKVLAAVPSGWRNLASGSQTKSYRGPDNTEQHVEYRFTRDGVVLPDDDGVRLVSATPAQVVLADATGAETTFDVSTIRRCGVRRLPGGPASA